MHYTWASNTDLPTGVFGERFGSVWINKFQFQVWKNEPNRIFLCNAMAFIWIPMTKGDAAMLCHPICLAKKGQISKIPIET